VDAGDPVADGEDDAGFRDVDPLLVPLIWLFRISVISSARMLMATASPLL